MDEIRIYLLLLGYINILHLDMYIVYIHIYIWSFTCIHNYLPRNMKSLTHTQTSLEVCFFRTAWWRGLVLRGNLAVPYRTKKAAGMTTWLPYEITKWQAHEKLLGSWGLASSSLEVLHKEIEHDLEKNDHDLIAVFTCLFAFLVNELNLSELTQKLAAEIHILNTPPSTKSRNWTAIRKPSYQKIQSATNIAMENGPFEDVFPIKNEIFHCYVSLPEGNRSGKNYAVQQFSVRSFQKCCRGPLKALLDYDEGVYWQVWFGWIWRKLMEKAKRWWWFLIDGDIKWLSYSKPLQGVNSVNQKWSICRKQMPWVVND